LKSAPWSWGTYDERNRCRSNLDVLPDGSYRFASEAGAALFCDSAHGSAGIADPAPFRLEGPDRMPYDSAYLLQLTSRSEQTI